MRPSASTNRVLLIEHRRGATPVRAVVPLRRYRLARLRLGTAGGGTAGRFDYLKRPHD